MCGMDEPTVDYVIAVTAAKFDSLKIKQFLHLTDKIAPAGLCFDISFRKQLFIGKFYDHETDQDEKCRKKMRNRRSGIMNDLTITLRQDAGRHLYEQIYDYTAFASATL